MSAADQIQSMIDRLRSLQTAPMEIARVVADETVAFIRRNVAAGVDPEGNAWPAKKDGGQPLQGAGAGVSASSAGPVAIIRLRPPWVFHHFGAQGKPVRRILPFAGIPKRLGDAIRMGIIPVWKKKMGGRGA